MYLVMYLYLSTRLHTNINTWILHIDSYVCMYIKYLVRAAAVELAQRQNKKSAHNFANCILLPIIFVCTKKKPAQKIELDKCFLKLHKKRIERQ